MKNNFMVLLLCSLCSSMIVNTGYGYNSEQKDFFYYRVKDSKRYCNELLKTITEIKNHLESLKRNNNVNNKSLNINNMNITKKRNDLNQVKQIKTSKKTKIYSEDNNTINNVVDNNINNNNRNLNRNMNNYNRNNHINNVVDNDVNNNNINLNIDNNINDNPINDNENNKGKKEMPKEEEVLKIIKTLKKVPSKNNDVNNNVEKKKKNSLQNLLSLAYQNRMNDPRFQEYLEEKQKERDSDDWDE